VANAWGLAALRASQGLYGLRPEKLKKDFIFLGPNDARSFFLAIAKDRARLAPVKADEDGKAARTDYFE
jgi:hypothetical protein